MRKLAFVIIALSCFFMVSLAYGVPFDPPVVTITGETVQWTEGDCVVPFTLEGRDCTVYLAIYTKGFEGTYGRVDNGMGDISRTVDLEYHTVVGLDTCIYVSGGEPFTVGSRSIVWDGTDKVGRTIEPGEYTYYLIAADETNSPLPFCKQMEENANAMWRNGWWPQGLYVNFWIQYYTADEGKLEKPRAWTYFNSFEFGQDTEDNVWTHYGYPEGGASSSPLTQIDPENDDIIYFSWWNGNEESCIFGKALLNEGAEISSADTLIPDVPPAEWVTDFADNGKLYYFGASRAGTSGGNSKYGVSVAANYDQADTFANLWVFDSETGEMIREIDMYEWLVSPQADIDRGAIPSLMGKWKWSNWNENRMHNQYHCSCALVAVNPLVDDNWLYWANMNGDYYLDHFYPGCQGYNEDMMWVCNSCTPGVFVYANWNDQNNITHYTANRAGFHQTEALGPDGYGLFYFNVLGHISGQRYAAIVHGNTAYDGLYCQLNTGEEEGDPKNVPAWVGYDSFKGSISTGVGIEAGTPVAYSLSNAPDPFNPSTTITYGMAKAGHKLL